MFLRMKAFIVVASLVACGVADAQPGQWAKLGCASNTRGWAYFHRGQYQNAIAAFNEVIRLPAQDRCPRCLGNAYEGRAWAYFYQGQYDQAVTDFTDALRHKPTAAIPDWYRR